MIALTKIDGRPIWVNPEHVVSVTHLAADRTAVRLSTGTVFEVELRTDLVVEKIERGL